MTDEPTNPAANERQIKPPPPPPGSSSAQTPNVESTIAGPHDARRGTHGESQIAPPPGPPGSIRPPAASPATAPRGGSAISPPPPAMHPAPPPANLPTSGSPGMPMTSHAEPPASAGPSVATPVGMVVGSVAAAPAAPPTVPPPAVPPPVPPPTSGTGAWIPPDRGGRVGKSGQSIGAESSSDIRKIEAQPVATARKVRRASRQRSNYVFATALIGGFCALVLVAILVAVTMYRR